MKIKMKFNEKKKTSSRMWNYETNFTDNTGECSITITIHQRSCKLNLLRICLMKSYFPFESFFIYLHSRSRILSHLVVCSAVIFITRTPRESDAPSVSSRARRSFSPQPFATFRFGDRFGISVSLIFRSRVEKTSFEETSLFGTLNTRSF